MSYNLRSKGKLKNNNDSTVESTAKCEVKTKKVLQDKPRTNNSQESWHKGFADAANSHPTFNKLLDHFRLEQKHTEILCTQIRSGKLTLKLNKKTFLIYIY